MSDQQGDAAGRTATQGGAGEGTPSEEIGHGPGLDPPGAPPDEDAEPRDEAYADRPAANTPSAPKDGREPVGQSDYSDASDDASAIQRPPADS
ncbi:hypothetical protein WMF37_45460 [Sorangium sp. So ce291]|uniref:hypothetical protein n=1 Tax=Sorangium sp. So ce291 TaxID=3133294 RepID=UPI003F5F1B04